MRMTAGRQAFWGCRPARNQGTLVEPVALPLPAEAPTSIDSTHIMTQHNHDHHHHGHDQHGHGHKPKGLHKDWRAWLVVGIMLFAMVLYVVTMDESIEPGAPTGPPIPAAE